MCVLLAQGSVTGAPADGSTTEIAIMRPFLISVWSCSLAALVAGCGETIACTTSVEPSLVVIVQDSITGSAQAEDAVVMAMEGGFEFALEPYGYEETTLTSLAGPYEREGLYTVTVTKAGYSAWQREAVRVTGDECHVRTVTVTARLQPLGGT